MQLEKKVKWNVESQWEIQRKEIRIKTHSVKPKRVERRELRVEFIEAMVWLNFYQMKRIDRRQ